jgi:hypothetical protein
MRDHFPRLLVEHLSKTKHKTGDINVVYCALCHHMFLTDSGVYGHIQKKHPEVSNSDIWFSSWNVRFRNVRFSKRQVFKTSGFRNVWFRNVRFTKRDVFKTSGCKTSGSGSSNSNYCGSMVIKCNKFKNQTFLSFYLYGRLKLDVLKFLCVLWRNKHFIIYGTHHKSSFKNE